MEPLRLLFEHHAWATLRLIDHCTRLSPEQLQLSAPGTRGTIARTLVHLVGSDQHYLNAMDGQEPAVRIGEGEGAPLADVRAAMELQSARWLALVEPARDLDVTLPAEHGDPEVLDAAPLIFLQAIHHGNDHRTQICTILGTLGLEVPELDGWQFWREERLAS